MTGETRLALTAAVTTVLASVSLYPLFTSATWFWACLGAIAVTLAGALLARRVSVPAALVPLAGLAGLLCYLTAIFAGTEAHLGFLPGRDAFEKLDSVAEAGFRDIRRYAAPVPSFTGITLVTAAGIGLVAILVDLLAVRARKAALAGLPLLAIFSVTSAIQGGSAGWLPFLCAAAGFSGLLLTDARDRVSRWGSRILAAHPGQPGHRPRSQAADTSSLAAAARRIGLVALAVAIAVPALLPELPTRAAMSGWLSGIGGTGAGPAGIRAPNPLVNLRRELTLPADREVLRYRSNSSTPTYLRLYALDEFDEGSWSMSSMADGEVRDLTDQTLPRPQGARQVQREQVRVRMTISREVRGLRFLPLPYPARQVSIGGEWRYHRNTLMVFSRSDVADGRSFEATSWVLRPTRQQLIDASPAPEDIAEPYTELPDSPPDLVGDLAREATRDADTDYARALALQEWFTEPGRFTYSLEPRSGDGSNALMSFLRNRVGYCEQFASAMAVMARILDIPARVAVGYTAGTQETGNEWVVTTHDAHAWPELYFDGIGWVRFEPTPSAFGGQPTASTPAYAQPRLEGSAGADGESPDSEQAGAGSSPSPSEGASGQQQPQDRPGMADGLPSTPGGSAGQPIPIGWVLAAVILALLLAVPAMLGAGVRWRRWRRAARLPGSRRAPPEGTDGAQSEGGRLPAPERHARGHGDDPGRQGRPAGLLARQAHAAWEEVCDSGWDLGIPGGTADSPRAFAARLRQGRELDAITDAALTRITAAEEHARYALTPTELATARADSRVVRKALLASAGWPRRLRARVLPAATLRLLQRLAGWLADGLDWVDAVGPRLRARLTRWRRPAT